MIQKRLERLERMALARRGSVDDDDSVFLHAVSPGVAAWVAERRKRLAVVEQLTGTRPFDHNIVLALLGDEVPDA